MNFFDVIVIGGGHAGTEAALASARLGVKTLLLTHNITTIGQMSCNPSIGGIGKSHLVKEIDALGGVMARAVDQSGIQFRILNSCKGPAVRATRAQVDRVLYKSAIHKFIKSEKNLFVFQQAVDDLLIKKNRVLGVMTQTGIIFKAKAVVLTVGTFLSAKIHIGQEKYEGGRAGDPPAMILAKRLRNLPFRTSRLKTGTPPRIDGRTINFKGLKEQLGDTPCPVMSFLGKTKEHPKQISCHITYTNQKTHDIVKDGLVTSPMYSGKITSKGPRYCPSIEDKVIRFSDKEMHQVFLEPEGLNTVEVYPNGISTSLSYDIQCRFVQSIKGLENSHIMQPGYAIEYDYFDPRDLKVSLETKSIQGLFFSGQINGTTGYEEAASQGLISGLNAARQTKDLAPWTPRRDEAYIGVLIDDLITQGVQEPYRMFTSRAEYRLLLRQDNADIRLTSKAYELGLISQQRWRISSEKKDAIEKEQQRLTSLWIQPNSQSAKKFAQHFKMPLEREYSAIDLLQRPEVDYSTLCKLGVFNSKIKEKEWVEQLDINAKYAGYLSRQEQEISRLRENEKTLIPQDLDYQTIKGLSNEIRQKLTELCPRTIGQASRVSGMTPTALSLLLIYIRKHI